jgi:hypothetical protein
MKKAFIAIGLVLLIVISVFLVINFTKDNQDNIHINEFATEINVDGWLKITKIFESDGKLALVAENVSDVDVEYALLTVKDKSDSYTFNISALLRGTKVVLVCNEDAGFNAEEIYMGWKTENIINYEKAPVMNDDKFEVSVTDGSISVKNISGVDITSDVFIYYKNKQDNMLNGNVTHRIRVSGLKADSQTYVKADGLNESNCQIIFTDYDD